MTGTATCLRPARRYVGDSTETALTGEGGRLLRLATDPDAADGKDSIYRYDRAGLLMALKSTGTGR